MIVRNNYSLYVLYVFSNKLNEIASFDWLLVNYSKDDFSETTYTFEKHETAKCVRSHASRSCGMLGANVHICYLPAKIFSSI